MDWAGIVDILRRSVAVCVTYNNSCNYTGHTDDLPDKGLRMLWANFMDQLDHPWAEFVRHCMHSLKRLPSLLDEALHAIKHHCDCPILLCADELIKASPIGHKMFSAPQGVVREIGNLLSRCSSSELNAIVTTIDVVLLKRERTLSGRPLDWIPLFPIPFDKMLSVEENCHPLLYKDFHAWWEVIYQVVQQQEEPFVVINSYYGIHQTPFVQE